MLIVDWISLGLIIGLGVAGLINGLTKELFSLAAWVVSLFGAWYFGPILFPYLENISTNTQLKTALSFVLIFLISFVILKLLGSFISRVIGLIGLGILDRCLGFIFGSVKATAILLSVFILASGYLEAQSWWKDSFSKEVTGKAIEFGQPLFNEWEIESIILLNKENVTFPPTL